MKAKAFERLVAVHYPAVYHLAANLCATPGGALALTHRTFEHARTRLARLRAQAEIQFQLLASLAKEASALADPPKLAPLVNAGFDLTGCVAFLGWRS